MSGKELGRKLSFVRAVGLRTSLQIVLYPWRSAWRVVRSHLRRRGLLGLAQALRELRPARRPDWRPSSWTFAGDVVAWERDGRNLTVRCSNAAVRLTMLAADVVRVRLSPSGGFLPLTSYAINKPEEMWPGASFQVEEGYDALMVRTERLIIRISLRPCRLTFFDIDGAEIEADGEGVGWNGKAVICTKILPLDEHIYGLGQKTGRLDRRDRAFTMWNRQPPPTRGYEPGEDPLYLNIPFYLGLRDRLGYGLFFDNTFRAHFDVGVADERRLQFSAAGGEMCYYFFYGPELTTVLEHYVDLTGRMPLPPLWALGYHQGRRTYASEAHLRQAANRFRERGIPCDALYLDIDYLDAARGFSWDPARYPKPNSLISDLKGNGFHTVVALDPALTADPKQKDSAQGLERGALLRYPDGTLFSGPGWAGEAYFADFTSATTREWWAALCRTLWAEAGVGGIANDMNEPGIVARKEVPILDELAHDLDGRGGTHVEAHNVYGMQMVRATREGWHAFRGADRPFVASRSGFAGVQRFGAHWTGDNPGTWQHLQLTIPMLLGLGLSGVGFTGSDTGGCGGMPDGELMVRWAQFSAFTPYFRGHAARWTHPREPWALGEPYESLMRAAIEQRYRLLPYIYTACWQYAEHGLPIVRPMCLVFQTDPDTHTIDDQFMLGDSLLVAPIVAQGSTSRRVYLPEGTWYHYSTGTCVSGPATVEIEAGLEEVPLVARGGSVVPMWPPTLHVEQMVDTLVLHIFPGNGTSLLYEDDGHSQEHRRGAQRVTRFELAKGPGVLELSQQADGLYKPAYSQYRLVVHGVEERPTWILADGEAVQNWVYDRHEATAECRLGGFERVVWRWEQAGEERPIG